MNTYSTPAKKARMNLSPKTEKATPTPKKERSTPGSIRSLKIDVPSSPAIPIKPSPAASWRRGETDQLKPSPNNNRARTEMEQEDEMMERFWRASGVEAAAEISSQLASTAVRLAAKWTLMQIQNERTAATLSGLGRVGWPSRAVPDYLRDDIPASWRALRASRRAEALATPPRASFKRKLPEEGPEPKLPPCLEMLGIRPITPRRDTMQAELAALKAVTKRVKGARSVERREREERRAMKFTREPEDEEDQLPLYEEMMEHEGHGCAYEVRGRKEYDPDTDSDSEEEMMSGATTNNINVVVCNH